MTKLVTGGLGYVGAELVRLLVSRGEEVVIFDNSNSCFRITDIRNKVKVVQGDLGNSSEVFNCVKDNKVTEIYHLGSMLVYTSELNPWASFRANVIGSYNILEAARLFGVQKMMFTSTLGTYGMSLDEVITDTSLQRPTTMYGWGKLYIEGLGRIYRSKFELDFRCIRYPFAVGPGVYLPGHWSAPMIEDAVLGKPLHECTRGTPETSECLMYYKDAARAADMVLRAPKEGINMVCYNVAGTPGAVSAGEMATILNKRFPNTKITFKANTTPQQMRRASAIRVYDDSYARKEWNWKPLYTTPEAIVDVYAKDLKQYPERYALA